MPYLRQRSLSTLTRYLLTPPPHPLRGVGTLRRLRSSGALRGIGGVVGVHGSLRKLRSWRRLARCVASERFAGSAPPAPSAGSVASWVFMVRSASSAHGAASPAAWRRNASQAPLLRRPPRDRWRRGCSWFAPQAPLMPPPHPLRGVGTLRRLRSSGALRGIGGVVGVHGSLRKLRSCRRLTRCVASERFAGSAPPAPSAGSVASWVFMVRSASSAHAAASPAAWRRNASQAPLLRRPPRDRWRRGCSWFAPQAPLMAPPRPLRGVGTLRRLRSSGALRGIGGVVGVHGSLRKLRSCRRLTRCVASERFAGSAPPDWLLRACSAFALQGPLMPTPLPLRCVGTLRMLRSSGALRGIGGVVGV